MRKILVIAPGGARARGGMGRMVAHLAERLAGDPEWVVETVDTYGPRVNEGGAAAAMPLYFAAAAMRLFGRCLAGRLALAHVQMAAFGSVYRKATLIVICRFFAVPVVLHLHGGDLERFYGELGTARRRLLLWVFAGVAEVIVLGEHWRRFVVTELAVPEARVKVLYNGVPRPASARVERDPRRCEILFLGMIWPEKGIAELLTALALPALADLGWRMTIAGIGRIDEYRHMALRLGIGDRVEFPGWADARETEALLARSDILVLPSHFECLPMAVIEAMAHGLPVVATPVGAVPEAIVDGETGLLVPVGDCGQLAMAIRRLVEDAALRGRLGAAARARFRERFDLDIFERRIREIYRKHMPAG